MLEVNYDTLAMGRGEAGDGGTTGRAARPGLFAVLLQARGSGNGSEDILEETVWVTDFRQQPWNQNGSS